MTQQLAPADPSEIEGFPATLPIEIALRVAPLPTIFAAYGLTQHDYARLKMDPSFRQAVARHSEELKRDGGVSFRMKAQLQADALLKKSWDLINSSHDDVPPAVKADLIKSTIKWAGLDASKDQASQTVNNALRIEINLA